MRDRKVEEICQENGWLLSLDQGGHSTRAIVFDCEGQVVTSEKYLLGVSRPQSGWVQQDAQEMLFSFTDVLERLANSLGPDISKIQLASLATQRSNSVCWKKDNGDALSPVISWQDVRTQDQLHVYQCDRKWIHDTTGLYLTAHYGATKFDWCVKHINKVQQAFYKDQLLWGPLASFLVYHLSKEHQHRVDPANASRTLLLNLDNMQWDKALLKVFHIPHQVLPTVTPTVGDYGQLLLNKHSNINWRVVCGDQSAAIYAYGPPKPGTLYINIGTGAFLQYFTGAKPVHVDGLLSGVAAQLDGETHYTVEATVNGAGSALTCIEDELGMDYKEAQAKFSHWLRENDKLPVFLNGISGLGSPFWQADFTSRFIHADYTGPVDDWQKIVAVAESILFLVKTNLQRMEDKGLQPTQIWVTGGLAATDELCQRLADICQIPVIRPEECEATARGVAALAIGLPASWEQMNVSRFEVKENTPLFSRYQAWSQAMLSELETR